MFRIIHCEETEEWAIQQLHIIEWILVSEWFDTLVLCEQRLVFLMESKRLSDARKVYSIVGEYENV